MPLYEHVFIARQDISNTQAEGLVEHFGKVVEENGGKVVGTEYWGLKNLAYKINKNRKGHYAYLRSDGLRRAGNGAPDASARGRHARPDHQGRRPRGRPERHALEPRPRRPRPG